jgi:hypothetical protein
MKIPPGCGNLHHREHRGIQRNIINRLGIRRLGPAARLWLRIWRRVGQPRGIIGSGKGNLPTVHPTRWIIPPRERRLASNGYPTRVGSAMSPRVYARAVGSSHARGISAIHRPLSTSRFSPRPWDHIPIGYLAIAVHPTRVGTAVCAGGGLLQRFIPRGGYQSGHCRPRREGSSTRWGSYASSLRRPAARFPTRGGSY